MKHNLQLVAYGGKSSCNRKFIYFSAMLEDLPIAPLNRLISLWISIRQNLLKSDAEIVLVFQKPYNTKQKRSLTESYNKIQYRQFPGCEVEARKFSSILKIVKVLIVNLAVNKITTKRDLYYQDVLLFQKSQRFSDDLVEMLANSLDVSTEDHLLLCASQKGLVFGNSLIQLSNGAQIELRYSDGPILIPFMTNNVSIESIKTVCKLEAIIVIEKDAVFNSFCNFIRNLENPKNFIIICGKGFPDKLTKKFVYLLSEYNRQLPILGFMDSDVYGISICKSYKFRALHNQVHNINIQLAGVFLLDYKEGWLDISTRDIRLMINFIKDIHNRVAAESDPENVKEFHKWHRELTRGLILFKKSEMNVIDSSSSIHHYIVQRAISYAR